MAALLTAGALLWSDAARADPPEAGQANPPAVSRGEAPSVTGAPAPQGAVLDPAQRREPAWYRGRQTYSTAGDTLVWIPRAILFPLFLVTEIGLRRPIYAGAEWFDRHHVVYIIDRVLHPTPDISWAPSVSLDLSTVTLLGAKGNFRNFLVPGHELKLGAEFGGLDAWRYRAESRWQIGSRTFAGARGDLLTRPDRAFYGIGPRSRDYRTNFSLTRYEGFAFAGFEYDNHLHVELGEGFRSEHTTGGSAPSIETVFPTSTVPGFGDLRLMLAMLDIDVDSRQARDQNNGFLFHGNVTYARDVSVTERSFTSAEADMEGAVEVSYPDRVLAARLYAMDTFALGKEPVPFTHQATLGWDKHYGFTWGRFRGESALMAQLQYRYPIAYYIDAQWTASVGNVFNQRFSDFSFDALTASLGVGLRTRRTGHSAVQLTFALGTARFDEPFSFENVRVYFGTSEGL